MDMVPEQSNILIVDDDEFIRGMLTSWLDFRGYQVTSATNGGEALNLHNQTGFDLILLDIMMPEVDGFEVLKQLKAEADTTPVIVMSALNDLDSVVECIKLGAEDYLHKPIESELLWARITASLEKKHYRDLQQTWLEELNLLQQIDQELNTTLNREEVSQLTLHWVTQKTKAVAAILGSVEGDLLKPRATHDLDERAKKAFYLSNLTIEKNDKEIRQEPLSEHGRLHPEANYRITIPITRNKTIQDILVLDIIEPVPETTMRFLKRLSVHIAIALHNAQLYADVQMANEAKSNFVAMVSHELKNPLTAIQSYALLLRRGVDIMPIDQQEEYLGIIYDGSKRIHNLALELDDVTQMETGQFRLCVENVSFKTILNELLNLMDSQIVEKRQTLTLNIPDRLPQVRADSKRLSQILTNLISNASKYTLESGHITVSARQISNGVSLMLYVSVKDTGIGIKPENQAKVFTQFFRADDIHVNSVRGTGLGLNITKKTCRITGR